MNTEGLLDLARGGQFEFVDLRYLLFPGHWHHHSLAADVLDGELLKAGVAIAGGENGAALHVRPAPATAFVDPFLQHPTVAVSCDAIDANGRPHRDDLRHVAVLADQRLAAHEVLAGLRLGATLQFFVFDQASFDQGINHAHCRVESREGIWRRGTSDVDSLGMQRRGGAEGSDLPPADGLHNLRAEMAAGLAAANVGVAFHGPGPATGGHQQIGLQPTQLLRLADGLAIAKYIIRNVAARHGKVASFMPLPLAGMPGSAMPITLRSAPEASVTLVDGDGRLSDVSGRLVAGIEAHAPALAALLAPTTNSFRRLARRAAQVGGQSEADSLTLPIVGLAATGDGLTCTLADASCGPHLALAAFGQALIDGCERLQTAPAESVLRPIAIPARLEGALAALRADGAFLFNGDVFDGELVERWIGRKFSAEVAMLRERPHPYEFCLYFDA